MATNGGKRPGAGRKKGSSNKVNAEIKARLAKSGKTPLEVIQAVMLKFLSAAETLEKQGGDVVVDARIIAALDLYERASEAASKAAPYCHAKLQSIEHTGKDGGPIKHDATISVEESYLRMVRGR